MFDIDKGYTIMVFNESQTKHQNDKNEQRQQWEIFRLFEKKINPQTKQKKSKYPISRHSTAKSTTLNILVKDGHTHRDNRIRYSNTQSM